HKLPSSAGAPHSTQGPGRSRCTTRAQQFKIGPVTFDNSHPFPEDQPPHVSPFVGSSMDLTSLNETHGACADTARRPQQSWSVDAVESLFAQPFSDLLHRAQSVHREHFDPNAVQLSTLLSIKTGGCPEDCAYCPQAARYQTGVVNEALMSVEDVVAAAQS